MFDYENITSERAEAIEDMPEDARISAILVAVQGIRKGIVSQNEGLTAIHNIAVSLLVA